MAERRPADKIRCPLAKRLIGVVERGGTRSLTFLQVIADVENDFRAKIGERAYFAYDPGDDGGDEFERQALALASVMPSGRTRGDA